MRTRLALFATVAIFTGCTTDEEAQLQHEISQAEVRLVERQELAKNLPARKAELEKLQSLYDRVKTENDPATLVSRLQAAQPGLTAKETGVTSEQMLAAHAIELSGTAEAAKSVTEISKQFPGTTVMGFELAGEKWTARLRIPLVIPPAVTLEPVPHPALPIHSFWSFKSGELRARLAKLQAEYDALGTKLAAEDFPDGDRRVHALKKIVQDELTVLDALKRHTDPVPIELTVLTPGGVATAAKVEFSSQVTGEATLRSGADASALKIEGAKFLDAPPGHVRWQRDRR